MSGLSWQDWRHHRPRHRGHTSTPPTPHPSVRERRLAPRSFHRTPHLDETPNANAVDRAPMEGARSRQLSRLCPTTASLARDPWHEATFGPGANFDGSHPLAAAPSPPLSPSRVRTHAQLSHRLARGTPAPWRRITCTRDLYLRGPGSASFLTRADRSREMNGRSHKGPAAVTSPSGIERPPPAGSRQNPRRALPFQSLALEISGAQPSRRHSLTRTQPDPPTAPNGMTRPRPGRCGLR